MYSTQVKLIAIVGVLLSMSTPAFARHVATPTYMIKHQHVVHHANSHSIKHSVTKPKPTPHKSLPAKPIHRPVKLNNIGVASWYGYESGPRYRRKPKTANGEIFNPNKLTAAHKSIPFGTQVQVTNLKNKKSVVVVINDRGPFVKHRIIDLSKAAATKIGISGTGKVALNILNRKDL